MAKANEKQIAGRHYKTSMECWDYIVANDVGYLDGNAIKYLTRWRKKNGLEDLKKAQHYLEKLIELEMEKQTALDWDVPDDVKQWGGLAGSMGAAQGSTNTMGGFCSASDVARQAWHGFSPDPEFLYDPTALNEIHLSGDFNVNDNV